MNRLITFLILAIGIMARGENYDYKGLKQQINNNNAVPWNASTTFVEQVKAENIDFGSLNGVNVAKTENNQHFQKFNDTNHSNSSNKAEHHRLLQTLPVNLDLRQKYPFCASIGMIRNQAGCGSCWAVASMVSLSDRYCIKNTNITTNSSGKAIQRSFSYEDALECCPSATCGTGGNGCNGGYLNGGYAYAFSVGVSTGDQYQNTTSGCKTYFLSPTQYASTAPTCKTACTYPTIYKTSYASDKMKISSYKYIAAADLPGKVLAMMTQLNTFGTLITFIYVYQDFFAYKTGIYTYQSGALAGGHAIRIIGYGTENGMDYWLIANSWGTSWGINGFAKIQKGVNMVSIEALPVAAFF